ncbi:hypothetical protein BHE74_00033881 [Ensete ventricosum]|nr:hypothetical protein GW17_00046983 [Ensete ventricosum]RWW59199.1 hypothetical protein BHE74_00033881 [Ensete ventricosum]RZR79610.1 hypothetical protein BHM03_00005357 [Ensete ventricosum]
MELLMHQAVLSRLIRILTMKTVQIARSASKPVRRSSEPRRNLLPRRPSPTASSSSGSRTLVWRLRRRERRSSTEMGGGFRLGILLAHAGYAPAIAKLNSLTHLRCDVYCQRVIVRFSPKPGKRRRVVTMIVDLCPLERRSVVKAGALEGRGI